MNECIDKRLGEKLYAYEIDLLSDEEREEFEIHLLECKYCNDRAQNFLQASDIIRNDGKIKKIVARLDTNKTSPTRSTGTYLKSALAIAAVLVILILQPWQIEFHSTKEAEAIENRLAILYFENLAVPGDSDKTGEIITDLLITDLSQSEYISVVSYQRLNDILKFLDKQNINEFDKITSSQIAEMAKANWVLTGKIHQVEPRIILTAQLTNISSDDVAKSYQMEGEANENLFMLVDKLTKSVKQGLLLPSAALSEFDSPVAEVTTHSKEAYLHYLEGVNFYSKLYNEDAKRSFEMALKYDSTFALAYYYLAILSNTDARNLILKAVEYSDKINPKDRLYIKSMEAFIFGDENLAMEHLRKIIDLYPDEKRALYQLGAYWRRHSDLEKAISYYERVIQIDPFNIKTLNELAYIYNDIGQIEKAIELANRCIEISPNDANPYDTKGELLAKNGRLDEAIEIYKKAISIKPDFADYYSLLSLGRLYVFSGDYTKARECFQEIIVKGKRLSRSLARTFMATIPLYQGKLNEALKILEDGITVDKMELATAGDNGAESYKHYIKGRIHVEKGELEIAANELQEAIRVHNIVFSSNRPAFRCMHAEVLAEAGDYDAAQEIVTILEKEYLADEMPAQSGYWYAIGSIELARGNYKESAEAFKKCVAAGPYFDFEIMLAKVLVKSGEYDEAIDLYRRLLTDYSVMFRLYQSIESVKAYYYLGMAYENTKQLKKAVTQYKKFLSLWENADKDLDEIVDAQKRLERISPGA